MKKYKIHIKVHRDTCYYSDEVEATDKIDAANKFAHKSELIKLSGYKAKDLIPYIVEP